MSRALVIVDIQNDYFPGGAYPLVGSVAAAERAASVLAAFREAGDPVVHIQHVWDAPDASFMRPGSAGVEIHPLVAPVGDEPVLRKAEPNAFVGTFLEETLRGIAPDQLVVLGMMSSMCVDSTVRAASEIGFDVTVVHDACAAPDLEFGGTTVPGDAVHAAFMAALSDSFATLVSADDLVGARTQY
ncbi:Isochorismatase [Leifsonia sp. Root227]|uniref:cysteine hydrolase family protein n=1 Tax=Leifsonia sp. Root227 TaxID=1736496 RepID=UPI0006FEB835|nr:cysteine hydrolase family protein [Leifsonia sp. Root227]KRC49616.1 Isochorismatase [Leifsonia sp. Root227]